MAGAVIPQVQEICIHGDLALGIDGHHDGSADLEQYTECTTRPTVMSSRVGLKIRVRRGTDNARGLRQAEAGGPSIWRRGLLLKDGRPRRRHHGQREH